MKVEFDAAKDATNRAVPGISLEAAEQLLAGLTVERVDERFDYGETRTVALGEIAGRVFVCVYTRRGEVFRPISLRPANRKERQIYEQTKQS
ncbi:MAG TPA: BrnT family toxin [Stellaceae bacterium]|nr:BrnT family toxin [Stellaceae bacterium]